MTSQGVTLLVSLILTGAAGLLAYEQEPVARSSPLAAGDSLLHSRSTLQPRTASREPRPIQ
jgi:hypothetical protein